MDWNDLRYFLAIARSGSLAAAARELDVEHTTVSRRLGALEAHLGSKLFARGPAGLTLTAVGKDILPCAEAIAAQVERLERRASGSDGKIAGTVRLTIPESGNFYFMQQLATLRARHPELVVEVLSDNRPLDLRRGEADVAVRFADTTDQELIIRKAGIAAWSLYASPAYVEQRGKLVALDELAGHVFLGFDASLANADGGRWLREHVAPASIVMRGNAVSTIARAAAAGMGIAPLPCFIGVTEPGLVRVTDEIIGRREILIVVHPDLVRVARVRATIDYMLELFARDAEMWSGAAPSMCR